MKPDEPQPKRYAGQILRDQIDPWKDLLFTCDHCGRESIGSQLIVGDFYETGFNLDCAGCHRLVACISHPMISEVLARSGQLPPDVLAEAQEFAKACQQFQKSKLTRTSQLPEIDIDHIVLIWDSRYLPENHNDIEIIIRCGEREVYRGPGFYEYYDYFISACKVLRRKYGDRLCDVIPTERTYFYLWGDRLSSPSYVEEMRKRIRAASRIVNRTQKEIPKHESWETYRD